MNNKVRLLCEAFGKLRHDEPTASVIKRKLAIMAQLKKIDPDAYTRWTEANNDFPPARFFNKKQRR